MNRYSIDIKVAMTAYVEAESEDEALAMAEEHFGTATAPTTMDLLTDYMPLDEGGNVELSPAVTFWGRFDPSNAIEEIA
jgi:hypothetical protein